MTTTNWPALTAQNRPWTRWWWLGSALSEAEITRHLELFQLAGIGGVEVSPIYGAKGYEDRYVPYLSERWIDLLTYTLTEADRLGLGVDMILGTGWPYGGPWVPDANTPQKMHWEWLASGAEVSESKLGQKLLAICTSDVRDQRLALFIEPTGQQVKRAAPGGEGNVVDHLRASSIREYLQAFEKPLSRLPERPSLRCIFNDSYEVFGANSTPDIFSEFAESRGYDLSAHLTSLHGDGAAETVRRVRSDYRDTIGDLVHDAFVAPWTAWANAKGILSRNQAHGSPGNLLDLYAAADIPETEVFGPPRLRLGGLKSYRSVPPDFGEAEEMLVSKMASSAAHVAGRPLCSSECFTWAGEHGSVPLEHLKAEVDTLLTLGINHIFFHGTPFSPADVPWPGWLFYATTHMAPTNTWWSSLPVLNAYIARCQSVLQTGLPDNDLLVYFPYYDLIASEHGAVDGLQFMTVGRTKTWLRDNLPDFVGATHQLTDGGWSFDLVSDRQLEVNVSVDGDGLKATGEARYKTVLVAGCRLMPASTMERLADLVDGGATVLLLGDFPVDVPGLGDLDARRERFRNAIARLGERVGIGNGIRKFDSGRGRLFAGDDLPDLLEAANVPQEPIAKFGIEYIRRAHIDGTWSYFLANPGRTDWHDWVSLVHGPESAILSDPMSGESYAAPSRMSSSGHIEIRLAIPAGASLVLQTADVPVGEGTMPSTGQIVPERNTQTLDLNSPWDVEFIDGGPTLPIPRRIDTLTDWTSWEDEDIDALRAFSGTARYRCSFDVPGSPPGGYFLDLGAVCHSAKITLNGEAIGTLIARPWRMYIPLSVLRPRNNILEIDVTNLMANRLSDLERRQGDRWRPFLMVNIAYKPFDAATWEPLPSGLVGPVRLLGVDHAI